MTQVVLIGIGAGAAAALLFGSVTSGNGFSVILFYLASLPIMIVALGWSHWAGLTAAAAAAALLAGALLPDLAGLAASLFAATLTVAFAMIGFAVMHSATRHMRGRAVVLSGAYGCVLILVWPVIVMTLIGVAETLFDLRMRSSQRGPPAAHDT